MAHNTLFQVAASGAACISIPSQKNFGVATKATRKAAQQLEPELPPTTPTTRAQLKLAITLLGCRARGDDLNRTARQDLVVLVGAYPNPPTAGRWKRALKSVSDDEIF